jgi:hypothetical protein
VRARRRVRPGLVGVLAVGLAGLAAACGGITVTGLDGSLGHGTSAGVPVLAGEPADYTAFLANHTGQVIVLKSARLLPLPGFAEPRLAHVAIESGRDYALSAIDWPPSNGDYHLRAFAGMRVAPGQRVKILYSVAAFRLGQYGDAGIRVMVQAGGDTGSADVQSVAGTCVVPSRAVECPVSFQRRIEKAAG